MSMTLMSTAVTYSSGVNGGLPLSTVNSNHLQQWCQWGSTTLHCQQQSQQWCQWGSTTLHCQQQSQQWCQWGSTTLHCQQQSLTAVVSMGGLSLSTVNSNHLQQWCQWGVYHSPQSTAITYSSGVNRGSITLHRVSVDLILPTPRLIVDIIWNKTEIIVLPFSLLGLHNVRKDSKINCLKVLNI